MYGLNGLGCHRLAHEFNVVHSNLEEDTGVEPVYTESKSVA